VAAHFDEEGESEPVVVSATRRHSHRPELAAGADGTPRVAWLEAVGDNGYEVVVASAATEALEALGGFRLTDLWGEVLSVWFAGMSLLFYAPMVIGWIVLPLGLVLVVTLVSRISLQGWRALAWLGVVMLLQLACKRFLAPQLTPLQSLVQLGLFLAPAVLGSGLVWVYWRRAERRSLLTAYGLFAAVDAVFSLFVLLPRVLWAI
jgi:hypothetical protein